MQKSHGIVDQAQDRLQAHCLAATGRAIGWKNNRWISFHALVVSTSSRPGSKQQRQKRVSNRLDPFVYSAAGLLPLLSACGSYLL